MIQMPMYVCDCWRDILKGLCIRSENLTDVYSTLIPSNRKVVQILQIPGSLNAQTNEVSKYLKRYVRELDLKVLCLFLRFCTGSDLITVPNIAVEFVNMTGLSKRPIGHTCGCVLQIGDY
ncbi:hypothetical protein ACJMK2_031936 [Sinanodonta woodiana]|uniref:Uncharacterized protein n=1 Tax=Sinanodonta woodiana TaxID=1069815 RepID=A0ABD3X089_SINWO